MCVRIKPNLRETSESLTEIEPVTFSLPVRCSNLLSYTDAGGERRLQCVRVVRLVRSDMCTASAVATYLEFINSILSCICESILSIYLPIFIVNYNYFFFCLSLY